MKEDEDETRYVYEFDGLRKLQIEFTDGRKRTYVADSYEVTALMVHLFCQVDGKRQTSHIIPYMLVRQIEVQDQGIKGLLKGKRDG